MNLILGISKRISQNIKESSKDESANINVMTRNLALKINKYTIIILSLLIGFVTGEFINTALAVGSFALLRSYSGGHHLKSLESCVIVSVFLFTIIPHIHINLNVVLILTIISSILVSIFSTDLLRFNTRLPVNVFPRYKTISLLIVCSNFFFNSEIIALSLFVQSLLLITRRR